MTISRLILALACLAALPLNAREPEARPAAPAALVEEAMTVLRAREVIDQWPHQIVATNRSDPHFAQLKPEVQEEVIRLLRGAFDPARMYSQVSGRMAKATDARTLEAFLATWRSPAVQRVQELEVQAAKDLARPGVLEDYAHTLQSSPPSPERRKLVAELDRLTEGSETLAAIQAASYLASLSYDESEDMPDVKRQLEAMKPKLLASARAFTETLYLYTYRALSDADLRRYTALYQRPEVARVNRALNQAIGETIIGALELFFRAMRDLAKEPTTT